MLHKTLAKKWYLNTEKNFEKSSEFSLCIVSIKSANIRRTSYSYWTQLDPKMLLKHPIFKGGPVPPKNNCLSKIFYHVICHPENPLYMSFELIFEKLKSYSEWLLSNNLGIRSISGHCVINSFGPSSFIQQNFGTIR